MSLGQRDSLPGLEVAGIAQRQPAHREAGLIELGCASWLTGLDPARCLAQRQILAARGVASLLDRVFQVNALPDHQVTPGDLQQRLGVKLSG